MKARVALLVIAAWSSALTACAAPKSGGDGGHNGGSPAPARCGSPSERAPALGQSFKLGVGERSTIAGESLTLTFQELVGDSRCPVGVVCVWEGEAKIRVRAERPPADPAVLELSTSDRSGTKANYSGYAVQLLGVAPAKEAGRTVEASEYCAEIQVVRGDGDGN